MHKLVLYLSVALLSFSSVAFAQSCVQFNATLTNTRICAINYNIAPEYNNATANDELAAFFASMNPRVPTECATAYATYYCSVSYPSCSNVTSARPACQADCGAVLENCAGGAAAFAGAPLPLPERTDCAALTSPNCTTSTPDLDNYYCQTTERDRFKDVAIDTNIICAVKTPVVITNDSYAAADNVWYTFRNYAQQIYPGTEGIPKDHEACFNAFAEFYCGVAFAPCPASGAPGDAQRICRSACQTVITECAPFAENFTILQTRFSNYGVPNDTYCASFPETNCFENPADNVYLGFFFPNETYIPTVAPTSKPRYPPGGPARGGGIGAGVLVGLLLIIALLMLIMKKQDSR